MNELKRQIHFYYDIVAFWKIFTVIKKNKYDIVHTHQAKAGILGRIAARLAGVPVIIHTYHSFPFHDFMKQYQRRLFIGLEKLVSKITDKLISVSKLNLEKGVQLGIAARGKFITIYSGIDFSRFDISVGTSAMKRSLSIPEDHMIVGMVGRLSEQKAPQYLIQAIPTVLDKFPNTTFVIVGDGEKRKELEASTRHLNINGKARFLGSRNDVPALLHLFDIFILTSLWEGLGRSLTEAMYVGKPVISTAVEGVPELIDNGKTGLLIPTKDVEATANRLIQLLASKEMRENLGKMARQRVKSRFEVDLMIREIDRLCQQLLIQKKSLVSG